MLIFAAPQMDELIHLLIQRISQARGKGKLVELLQRVKAERDVRMRTTGSVEELENALQGAVVDGHVTVAEIKTLVDEIEETGGQHVFLFRLTAAGRAALTAQVLSERFQAPPNNVTPGFYGVHPRSTTVFIGNRVGQLIVKEVYTGTFWELDEDESEDTPTRITRVTVLRERRAVNLLRILPVTGDVEVRIDRLKGANDGKLALAGLSAFRDRLSPTVDFDVHLEPVPVQTSFPAMVAAEDETFMLSDRAADDSASQGFASRRDHVGRRTDIRKHPNYRLRGPLYSRDSLHIYWRVNGAVENPAFTVISVVKVGEVTYTKVYFSAKLSPTDLDYVISRIRQFAA